MHESESQDSPIHQTGTKIKFESERGFESKRGSAQTWNLSKKITPPDFQAKNFTPSILPNF